MGVAIAVGRLTAAAAGMELFRVTTVEVKGLRYLDRGTVVELADIPVDASVWDDPLPVVARLRNHPLVADVRVGRRLPHTVVLDISESEPVALLPTPTLRALDAQGRILPIDPSEHRLDLPLLRASLDPGAADALPSRDLRTLVEETLRIREIDPAFYARVSTIGLDSGGSIVVELFAPEVTIRYRAPATEEWLATGIRVLTDARGRREGSTPRVLDLRFSDQVVVGFDPSPLRRRIR